MGVDIFDQDSRGLIPRAISLIFASLLENSSSIEYTIKCSMLEIYKENLRDLLVKGPKLRIKEDPHKGIYVDGLSEVYVACEEEVLNALAVGEKNRSIASTKMNQQSSRSHQIFMLEVSQKLSDGSMRRGTLNLVDLAGCEKINQTGATGENLEEAKKINLSLSALGNVIHALTNRADHIPYRDSKLTRLLQESLGGNYKTTLIVNCSPHPRNLEDSVNTLRFAQRAKTIKNNAKINVIKSIDSYIRTIEKLKVKLEKANSEIVKLKKTISDHGGLVRNNTMMVEPTTPLSPVSDFGRCSNENLADFSIKIDSLTDQVHFLNTENKELRDQVREYQEKITAEKLKTAKAEEKALDFYYKLQNALNIDKEKEINYTKSAADAKRLEGQVQYLTKLLIEFSGKFMERLKDLKSGEEKDVVVFADLKIEEIEKGLSEILPGYVEKYFPEVYKISKFITYPDLAKDDVPLKAKLIESSLVNYQLNVNYWELVWKYTILRENFISVYSNLDLQKQQVSSFKKSLTQVQTSYSKIITKLNKIIQSGSGRVGNALRLRKPVNNAVPFLFGGSQEADRAQFLRKASLFHLVTNGLDGKFSEGSLRADNLQQKTIENNLMIQTMINKQVKSSMISLKEENIRLKLLIEGTGKQEKKLDHLENDKINKILEEVHSLFKEKHVNRVLNIEFSEQYEVKPAVKAVKKDNVTVKEINMHLETSSLHTVSREEMHRSINIGEFREESYILPNNGSLTPKIAPRGPKKAMTSPPDFFSSMRSGLSKTFLKALPPILEKKIGDFNDISS